MDTEPDPPRRPRRPAAAGVLIVVAMIVIAGHLAFMVIGVENALGSPAAPSWAGAVTEAAWKRPRLVYYGPMVISLALMGLSVVLQRRHR